MPTLPKIFRLVTRNTLIFLFGLTKTRKKAKETNDGTLLKPPHKLNIFFVLKAAESRVINLSPPMASATVRSKAVVLLLLINCLFLLPLFVGWLCLVLVLQCRT